MWLAGSNYAKDNTGKREHVARVDVSYSSFRTGVVGKMKILTPTSLWKGQ